MNFQLTHRRLHTLRSRRKRSTMYWAFSRPTQLQQTSESFEVTVNLNVCTYVVYVKVFRKFSSYDFFILSVAFCSKHPFLSKALTLARVMLISTHLRSSLQAVRMTMKSFHMRRLVDPLTISGFLILFNGVQHLLEVVRYADRVVEILVEIDGVVHSLYLHWTEALSESESGWRASL